MECNINLFILVQKINNGEYIILQLFLFYVKINVKYVKIIKHVQNVKDMIKYIKVNV